MDKDVFDYIKSQEVSWKTVRIPLTNSKDWNMSEHIERCYNVANGWFHQGKNDGLRPYDDLVTPIVDVAFRARNFDVKDIVPFVNQAKLFYKSFIVKKYHQKWALENHIDTIIDEIVESSVIYDLVLVKNTDKPEVIPLQSIAFCDQKDVLSGPICIRHEYSIADLRDMSDKWDSDMIEFAISHADDKHKQSMANDQESKTPGMFVEVYELHGKLPDFWLNNQQYDPKKFSNQMHIVSFYKDNNGEKQGITLFKGKDKPVRGLFDALKVDSTRSIGRACGRSIVERLFEPQVWSNYSSIRIKEMLDSASLTLAQSSGSQISSQKLEGLRGLTVLKTDQNQPITRIDTYTGQNMNEFVSYKNSMEKSARMLGNASEASLGVNPSSGTPFSTVEAILQQGEGIHDYARGKIATFLADVLYPKHWIKQIIDSINSEQEFYSDLSMDELAEIAESISVNKAEEEVNKMIFKKGIVPTNEERQAMREEFKRGIVKGGRKRFFKTLKDELKDAPIKVRVNIAGKQQYLARNADKLSKLVQNIMVNPQAFAMIPGLGSVYNQLIEDSGLNPIDFSQMVSGVQLAQEVKGSKVESPVGKEELKKQLV